MGGDFRTDGYQVVRGFVSAAEAELFSLYALRRCQLQSGFGIDSQVGGGLAITSDPLFDALLFRQVPTVRALSGHDVLPTYAYSRVHLKGAVLHPHTDRPACEVSVTLCLAMEPAELWSIHVDANGETEVRLAPGDALLYKGCEVTHWREPFVGRGCVQVFLHYVDREGPYADHAFDAVSHEGGTRPRALPGWEHAEDYHQRLTVYQELLADQAAAKEQS